MFEEHILETYDKFEIVLHRLYSPFSRKRNASPILMMPQIDGSSFDYVANDKFRAPGFQLARAGYDVWLGNARGNFYSYKSSNMTSKDPWFWHFGPEEQGLRDVKSFIDYILYTTGQKKVTYYGQDLGNQMFFMAASVDPFFFNQKIDLFFAINPRTKLDSMGQLMGFIWFLWAFFVKWFQDWGWWDVRNRNSAADSAIECF